jgi:hypothetical protein
MQDLLQRRGRYETDRIYARGLAKVGLGSAVGWAGVGTDFADIHGYSALRYRTDGACKLEMFELLFDPLGGASAVDDSINDYFVIFGSVVDRVWETPGEHPVITVLTGAVPAYSTSESEEVGSYSLTLVIVKCPAAASVVSLN